MTKEKTLQTDFLGLKTKREAAGITLKDVFRRTRISVVNLEAIESGAFDDLPVPIYTKNFIKTYARELNIDSKPILESYEAYISALQPSDAQAAETEPRKEPIIKRVGYYKTHIWAAIVILVIAVVAFFASQQYPGGPEMSVTNGPKIVTPPQPEPIFPPNQPVPAGEQVKSVPATVATEINKQAALPVSSTIPGQKAVVAPKLSPQQNAPKVENTLPAIFHEEAVSLAIISSEETWLRIKIDQNPAFQVLLKAGEGIERKGATFDMDIGNAGGVKIKFKGKVIENMGKSGQVIHLRLP